MIRRCWKRLESYGGRLLVAVAIGLAVPGCSAPPTAPESPGAVGSQSIRGERTALDEYVARPDTNYSFRLIRSVAGKQERTFILEMTSQAWLTTNEVDRPLWKHWLVIVRPNEVATSKSLLLIGGGANGDSPPEAADSSLVHIALATKSVVSELRMVPNQPLVFSGESRGRSEDSLIAYTWDKFLRTGDAKWPARLPMTKAAVRAMDTVTAFAASAEGGKVGIDGFVVAGGSKRGWTTWTTAAVDPRVVAIVPIVIDLLNIEPSMNHHYAAYGFWAPSVKDYSAMNLMDWAGTPEYRALMRIEEPYQYRQRMTLPKFIINACGDQFFLPDSSQFYFKDLPGIKYLRYVPNADHSLKGSDARQTLLACYHAVLNRVPLPRFSWTLPRDGSIRVTTLDRPSEVKLWQATNPDARDFRLETFGPHWQSSPLSDHGPGYQALGPAAAPTGWRPLTAHGGGLYVAKVPPPGKGWTAFMVELTFPSGCEAPFKFTTPVRVVPDTLPFKFTPKGKDITAHAK
ncbi:MAG TPA: PhoPQ-activated pathogenicity-related family protein [Dongiaceae bacterium]|nr:PhoPQ-activated pathogenicity-related family protein [Dongiaceae bacterium]